MGVMGERRGHGGGGGGGGGEGGEGGGMRWLLTYADMITLLLALFIFLFSISSVNAAKLTAFSNAFAEIFGISRTPFMFKNPSGSGGVLPVPGEKRNPKDNKPLPPPPEEPPTKPSTDTVSETPGSASKQSPDLKDLKQELESTFPSLIYSGKFAMEETSEGLLMRISDTTLFDLGSATITPQAVPVLNTLSELLQKFPNNIRVEGHTDALPITSGRYSSNWELSGARAASVVAHFIERDHMDPARLSLAGYGEYRPIAPEEPGKGNPANRRVEIMVIERPKETEAYEAPAETSRIEPATQANETLIPQ